MRMFRFAALLASLLVVNPALAQWQTPNHSAPIGRGGGVIGFGSAAPGTSGQPLVSTGAASDPAFGQAANAGILSGAANTLKGSLNGSATVDAAVPACAGATQGLKWTAGVGFSCAAVINVTGFDMPINLGLSVSSNTTALTINVTQADGTTPTSANPVVVPFRSLTATNGTVTLSSITSALSMTIPSGATLGTSSGGVPFRVWIFLEANGGTPELGVATCSNATTMFPCTSWETTLKTSTTISVGSTAAGTLYSPVGVANDSVRIVGYCDYATGLVTAGTWAGVCTTLQIMGPGISKPGAVVQTIYKTNSQATAPGATTLTVTNLSQQITPTSLINPILAQASGNMFIGSNAVITSQIYRDAVAVGSAPTMGSVSSNASAPSQMMAFDLPNVASPTYAVKISGTATSQTWNLNTTACVLILQELMG